MRENLIPFYYNLSKLFYAITAIDGVIREEEYRVFLTQINTLWLSSGIINKSSSQFIINTFETLKNENSSAQACFDEFKSYKKQHENLFPEKTKKAIWETACVITSEVNNKNKSELIILVHLGKLLQIM
ncbi:hypothetical protein [uncultured Tenacibaculum sp.]|uniref:hypothetical protein n=1 Tax=uncultured Tenacibaculum sp. TaxID=174713 RepID=UPI00262BF869|nr:hypothetical protein [uncultured Tenacibaculum sp.]